MLMKPMDVTIPETDHGDAGTGHPLWSWRGWDVSWSPMLCQSFVEYTYIYIDA